MNVRVACAQVIAAIIRGEASLNSLLPMYSQKVGVKDAGMLQELCYGTLRHYHGLNLILGQLLQKPVKTKEAEVTALLLSALYQIREMRTPPHAAVNETVSALKALKKQWARGLLNGVLREYLRRQDDIDRECAKNPAFHHMHPAWLADQLEKDWPDEAPNIMVANNQRPPMCLRVNLNRITREGYLSRLQEASLTAKPATFSPAGIYLDNPCNVDILPGFAEGLVSVQDEAAQLCAPLLDLAPGQRVLDACSAPGGKTGHILEMEPALGEIVALDVDDKRLAKVADNLLRLRYQATLKTADAGDIDTWWDGQPFDRILLDAPCSATGVIRRHPDIKLLRKYSDIVKLSQLQETLLRALWPTLKPGGTLLYATCSVIAAENDGVLQAFTQNQTDCQVIPLDKSWGKATSLGRQLFPQHNAHDGFYLSLLLKKA